MMPAMARIILWLALVLCTLSVSSLGHAQWDPAQQFSEGLERFDNGDFEGALPFFENAFERTQSPNARLYVARCLNRLERYAEAYVEMKGTLDLAAEKADSDEKYAQTRDAAAAELALLEPKVAKVVVAFADLYPAASAYVNGRELPDSQYGVPIVVPPGAVEVKATAEGKDPFVEMLALEPGETRTVAIALVDAGGADTTEDEGPSWFTPLRITGIAVAALGVGGLVTFGVTGSIAKKKFEEVEACGMPCPPGEGHEETIDDGKTMQTVANVTLGVGIALAVGGAALIVFGGPSGDDAETPDEAVIRSLRVGALPLPGGGAVAISGSF